MLEYQDYLGVVEADEGAFVGRVAGLRDVVTCDGATFTEVEQAFRDRVDDYHVFCAERSEPPDRPSSSKIPLRVDPWLHRRAAANLNQSGSRGAWNRYCCRCAVRGEGERGANLAPFGQMVFLQKKVFL